MSLNNLYEPMTDIIQQLTDISHTLDVSEAPKVPSKSERKIHRSIHKKLNEETHKAA